jgi:hypothetical protein
MLDESLTYRQIFVDGRKLETEPNPSWMGYSVGHWDGDSIFQSKNDPETRWRFQYKMILKQRGGKAPFWGSGG